MLSKARTKKQKQRKRFRAKWGFFSFNVQDTAFLLLPFWWFDIKQNEVFSTPGQVSGNWLCFLVQFKDFLIGLLMCTK